MNVRHFLPLDIIVIVGMKKLGSISLEQFTSSLTKAINEEFTSDNKIEVRTTQGNTFSVVVNMRSDTDTADRIKMIANDVGFNLACDAGDIVD